MNPLIELQTTNGGHAVGSVESTDGRFLTFRPYAPFSSTKPRTILVPLINLLRVRPWLAGDLPRRLGA